MSTVSRRGAPAELGSAPALSAAGRRKLTQTIPIAGALILSTCAPSDARLNEEKNTGNMFTPPQGARQAPPHFTRTGRRADDDIPGWDQVRMIPSLSPSQREQIQTIYLNARKDMAGLRAQLVALREQQGLLGGRGQRAGGRFSDGQFGDAGFQDGPGGAHGFREPGGGGCRQGRGRHGPDARGFGPGSGDIEAMGPPHRGPGIGLRPLGRPGTGMDGPLGPPGMEMDGPPGMEMDGPPGMGMDGPPGMGMDGPPGMGMDGPPGMGMDGPPGMRMHGPAMARQTIDPQVRAQVKEVHGRILSKRLETWKKVQLVLTQPQLTELEQMRNGELLMSREQQSGVRNYRTVSR